MVRFTGIPTTLITVTDITIITVIATLTKLQTLMLIWSNTISESGKLLEDLTFCRLSSCTICNKAVESQVGTARVTAELEFQSVESCAHPTVIEGARPQLG